MQLVIIAGGFGTRLRPLTLHRPKALVPLLNRPQILHVLERLPPTVDQVILAVNYMYEEVRDYFEARELEPEVIVVNEREPLGTGGAIKPRPWRRNTVRCAAPRQTSWQPSPWQFCT